MKPSVCILCPVGYPYDPDKFVGLRCSKDRGFILPGGKVEDDETYHAAAHREFKEETGLILKWLKYIHTGFTRRGRPVHVYYGQSNWDASHEYVSDEGEVVVLGWDDLFDSVYGDHYRCVRDIWVRNGYYNATASRYSF